MRPKRVGIVLVLMVAVGCSSGAGGEDDAGPLGKGLERMQVLPSRLGDRVCDYPEAFNNRSEALLSCRPEGADFSGFGTVSYALWNGGDALQDLAAVRALPPIGPGEKFVIAGLADNGTVFGTIGDAEDFESSSLFSPKRGFRADVDGYFEYPFPVEAVSSNGEHVLTTQFIETSPAEGRYESQVYQGQRPVTLAPFPAGVAELNPPSQIRNDGTVGGTALVGQIGQTFAAGYGYYRSQTSFELIAPPGRPELAGVFAIYMNNTGSAALVLGSNTSYVYTDSDGTEYTQELIAAAFVGKDGAAIEISNGDPNVQVEVIGINDRDIVYGSYEIPSDPEHSPPGYFVFSPRSGFQKLEDLVPGADAGWIYKINNANQVLIGTDEGIIIVELPDGL